MISDKNNQILKLKDRTGELESIYNFKVKQLKKEVKLWEEKYQSLVDKIREEELGRSGLQLMQKGDCH